MKIPQLVAHRGLAAHAPENTCTAVRAAIEAGVRFVEIDVQLSQDAVAYLLHDRTLARMCGDDRGLHEFSSRQLAHLRASEPAKFGETFADEPLARLGDFVDLLCNHPDIFGFIEIKRAAIEQFGVGTVLDSVLSELGPLTGRCALISFSVDILAAARQRTDLPLGPVLQTWEQRNSAAIAELESDYIFVDHLIVPADDRFELGQAQFVVYEVAQAELALDLHRRGAEFVETFAANDLASALAQVAA